MGASNAIGSWPWASFALGAVAPVLAMIGWRGSVWTVEHLFWVDLALGPAIACLPPAFVITPRLRLQRAEGVPG